MTVDTIQINGSTTLGDSASDSVTVNAASTFSAAATFSNTVVAQQTLDVTSTLTCNDKVVATSGFEPATDLGADLGSNLKSFANVWVGGMGIGDTNGDSIVNLKAAGVGADLILKSNNGEVQLNRQGSTVLTLSLIHI